MHIGDRYGQLMQMSYITRDMDAAIAHCETELGLTGFSRSESEIEVLSYGTVRKLAVKAAIATFGPHACKRQFELIQPISGPTEIYTDEVDLSRHIVNYHHIAIGIPGPYSEWERLLADVQASGDELAYLFPAVPDPASKLCFCYVDTRKRIGHYTEYLWANPALAGIAAAPWLEG